MPNLLFVDLELMIYMTSDERVRMIRDRLSIQLESKFPPHEQYLKNPYLDNGSAS